MAPSFWELFFLSMMGGGQLLQRFMYQQAWCVIMENEEEPTHTSLGKWLGELWQEHFTLWSISAKSLQSCPTLCNPIDSSPPGSPSLGFSRQEHWSGLPFPSPVHKSEKWKWRCSVVSDSSRPHGLQPTRLPYPWDFPGKSTGGGCHCLLWSLSACLLKNSEMTFQYWHRRLSISYWVGKCRPPWRDSVWFKKMSKLCISAVHSVHGGHL